MDVAEFQIWLGGIERLSAAQRRQTFQALDGTCDRDAGKCSEAGAAAVISDIAPDCALPVEDASALLNRVGTASLAEIGQRRVEYMGCPHCSSREVILWGSASTLPRYRCKSCGHTFNALTKTPLAQLRKKDKWLEHSNCMIDGLTVSKTAKRCGVHYTTAFRWRHRFLASISLDKPNMLSGIVEGDEMFILESCKGKRPGIPRVSRKRGGKASKRGLSAE
jgi:transposase-like protein